MTGSPLKRQRKAGVVDPVTGELVPFPYLRHPRAGLSNAQWRALSPGEKIERLLNMSLDRAAEILTWPVSELDPLRLSLLMQVWRIVHHARELAAHRTGQDLFFGSSIMR